MNLVALKEKVKKIKKNKNFIPWTLFVLACLVILYLSVFSTKSSISDDKQKEINSIIKSVGKLVILPDEVPTVATITDLEKLKGQAFFQNAKVGDKILIYIKAQKAILYDPTLNKVVDLAPLNTTGSQDITKPQ